MQTRPQKGKRPLTAPQKAAALLLSMEKPLATRLLKYFDDAEVKTVAHTASQLGALPQPELEELIKEFAAAFGLGSDLQGSVQAAAELLEGVLPPDRVSDIIAEIRGNSSSRVWNVLKTVPDTITAQYLARQHPQVATLILSKMDGRTVANVLEQLPVPLRVECMRRMLSLKQIADTPQRLLEINLQLELVNKASRNLVPDTHARIAAVLNKMSREAADAAFAGLSEARPKDAEKIKGLLFTFDDIARLNGAARTKLFEEIPIEMTIAALRGISSSLQEQILVCLSQRGRRMIEAELSGGRAPTKAEISKAQRAIADRALELVERGVIEIGGDGE